eukprot:1524730-Rhodomonas_salina.2
MPLDMNDLDNPSPSPRYTLLTPSVRIMSRITLKVLPRTSPVTSACTRDLTVSMGHATIHPIDAHTPPLTKGPTTGVLTISGKYRSE